MVPSCFYLPIDTVPVRSCVQLGDFRPPPAPLEPTAQAQISCLPLQPGPSAWFPVAAIFSPKRGELVLLVQLPQSIEDIMEPGSRRVRQHGAPEERKKAPGHPCIELHVSVVAKVGSKVPHSPFENTSAETLLVRTQCETSSGCQASKQALVGSCELEAALTKCLGSGMSRILCISNQDSEGGVA